jgi:uncharacterized membrane protein YbhN (UPF0104 family)
VHQAVADGRQQRKPDFSTAVEDAKALAMGFAMEAETLLGRRTARVLGVLVLAVALATVIVLLMLFLDWYIDPTKPEQRKDVLTLTISAIGIMVAAFSAARAIVEYRKQGVTKRAEIFLQMRTRLREDVSFKNICDLLETDDESLKDIPIVERDRFLGFFEELALLRNSGFINDRVAFYMFGYYAARCRESRYFWRNLDRKHELWALFLSFAEQMQETERRMQEIERTFWFERRQFRL